MSHQIEVTVEVYPQDEADTEVPSSGKEEPMNTKGECNALIYLNYNGIFSFVECISS